MRSLKSLKIDHNSDYPCPCRRQGRIKPIYLTEAFGCDLCQQIFALEENGNIIEQVTSVYPYKKGWCWNGKAWVSAHKTTERLFFWPLFSLFTVLIAIFVLHFHSGNSSYLLVLIPWLIGATFWGTLIILALWIIYR